MVQQLKKYIAVWGFVAFLALVLLPAAAGFKEPALKIFISLGTSIFSGLTLSYFLNRAVATATNYDMKTLIQEKFPQLFGFEKNGLTKMVYENNLESIGLDIVTPPELYIVMNEGKNFLDTNLKDIQNRFKLENKTTFIVLMSADSESERIFNERKKKSKPNYFGNKAREAKQEYIAIHEGAPKSNRLIIYIYDYTITMSIVATEKKALAGLYRNSSQKILIPRILFTKTTEDCEYNNIMNDAKNLIRESREAYNSSYPD